MTKKILPATSVLAASSLLGQSHAPARGVELPTWVVVLFCTGVAFLLRLSLADAGARRVEVLAKVTHFLAGDPRNAGVVRSLFSAV